MKSLKKEIKKKLPDRLIYLYMVISLIPRCLKSIIKEKNAKYPKINFYNDIETVDKIVNEHKSVSRFGDGEIRWMAGVVLDSFQEYSDEFAKDLKIAFQSSNSNLLIGIPYGLVDSSRCNLYSKLHWKTIKSDFFKNFIQFADLDKIYCNASITRPYIDYKDREYSRKCFENLRRIWDKRNVVFVEGEKTKLGLGNDLFNNVESVKRIICPSKNAYGRLDDIKSSIISNVDKNDLILTALGPTASILAAQICELGYQIVDIGHVDIEYWWYNHKSILRDEVPGKYVNESGSKYCANIYDYDNEYIDSIVDKIV